jgi:hypothetical protein
MSNRRDFLKMFAMASIATALPISSTPERLTIPLTTGDGDMKIGVNGVERIRIYSNGNVGISCINPPYELKIKNNG